MLAVSALTARPVEHVLYSFPFNAGAPNGGLVADSAGNLYGTTRAGGNGFGTVFELSPPASEGDSWTETVLYAFNPNGNNNDGSMPYSTLIFDKLGNLYGTTEYSATGWGTVFELAPPTTAGASWSETILFNFPIDGTRGAQPQGKLVFDGTGNLYGTTLLGGSVNSIGTVFRLHPPATAGGVWNQAILHNFGIVSGDGYNPGTALMLRDGVVYGTTQAGGSNGIGTVFQLAAQGGHWTETVLYSFTGGSDGSFPAGGLIRDSAGNLYGTTFRGGISACSGGCGAIYELSPPAESGGSWQETTLYTFPGGNQGGSSYAALVRDKLGNLFGTGSAGGFKNNGVVFKLIPPAAPSGAWTEVTMHVFNPVAGDGALPYDELILIGGKGLFGTTWAGGTGHGGSVFIVGP
jgi:uncharacterized repeat protein (TIGR03803 family)